MKGWTEAGGQGSTPWLLALLQVPLGSHTRSGYAVQQITYQCRGTGGVPGTLSLCV